MRRVTNYMTKIEGILHYLRVRLVQLDETARQGVIPGQLDTYELEQMIGRIKEIKRIIAIIEDLLNE